MIGYGPNIQELFYILKLLMSKMSIERFRIFNESSVNQIKAFKLMNIKKNNVLFYTWSYSFDL